MKEERHNRINENPLAGNSEADGTTPPHETCEAVFDLARLCWRKRIPLRPEFAALLERCNSMKAETDGRQPMEFAELLEWHEERLSHSAA